MRARCFFYLLTATASLAFSSTLKLLFVQPRPYWVNADIKAMDCQSSFGNPSGHSLVFTAVIMTAFLDFNDWMSEQLSEKPIIRWVSRTSVFLLVLGLCAMVGYSRFFLGAHSLN